MIQLYAITDQPGPALPAVAALDVAVTDGLAAVWGPSGEVELTPAALWRHEVIVEALMRDRDLLPFRYGTRVEDASAATRSITERHAHLSAALDGVRGAIELAVRVRAADSPEPAFSPPRRGMQHRHARARAAGARAGMLSLLHEPLCSRARASVHAPPRDAGELMRTAYLVDRAAVEHFAALLSRLGDTHRHLSIACTGPWPPYSFCGGPR